jgi:RNA 2',3'-cyclic 3'-phosphodiesterase
VRSFIAIDLPEDVHAALEREQQTFRRLAPEARWTRPEGIHLTLKFLGEVAEERVKAVSDALADLGAFEKFPVEVRGFGFFPNARRPRVFWAGIESPPALGELAGRVEAAMEELGFAREQRDFHPHLTLARFKEPRPQPELAACVEVQSGMGLGRFEAAEFFLYESKLSPHGAVYRKVARFPAPSSPQNPS